jgi:hypothetical protein
MTIGSMNPLQDFFEAAINLSQSQSHGIAHWRSTSKRLDDAALFMAS